MLMFRIQFFLNCTQDLHFYFWELCAYFSIGTVWRSMFGVRTTMFEQNSCLESNFNVRTKVLLRIEFQMFEEKSSFEFKMIEQKSCFEKKVRR